MLSEDLVQKLNEQITSEAYAAQIYLQMALWCEELGLAGAGAFFRSHVSEEMSHRDRLVDYMIESDAKVALEAIPAPRADYQDLIEVIRVAYEHEQLVTKQIHDLARLALDTNDFSTFNMLQWFIAEQRAELMLFRGIVDYIRLSGFDGTGGDEMVNMNKYLAGLSAAHTN